MPRGRGQSTHAAPSARPAVTPRPVEERPLVVMSDSEFERVAEEFSAELASGDLVKARETQQRLLLCLGDTTSAAEAAAASGEAYAFAVRVARARQHLEPHSVLERTDPSLIHRAHRLTEDDLRSLSWPRAQGDAMAHLRFLASSTQSNALDRLVRNQRITSLNAFRHDLAMLVNILETGAVGASRQRDGIRADVFMRAATVGVLHDLTEEFGDSPAFAGPVAISRVVGPSGPTIEVGVRFAVRQHGVPLTVTVYLSDLEGVHVGPTAKLERRLQVGRKALKDLQIDGAKGAPLVHRRNGPFTDFRGSEQGLPDGDLVEMLGAAPVLAPCTHSGLERTQWAVNATRDAICLGCKVCDRNALLSIPLHRVLDQPKGSEAEYLALQSYYQTLAGDERPVVSFEQLRARDGHVDLERVARTRKVPSPDDVSAPKPAPMTMRQAFSRR